MAVPGINRGATGAPGAAGYPNGITTGIFNELNYVIPDYIPKLIAKYGNDSYALAQEMLGRTVAEEATTDTATFSHFERGRIFGVGLVNANVPNVTVAGTVNIIFKSPESYNDGATGTQSPFLNGQTVKLRSNGRKASISNINRTTPGAFSATLTPLGNYALITGTTGTTLNAGEGIETWGGTQLAGEASGAQGTIRPKIYRYDNTCTVIRDGANATDLATMNKTQVDFGDGNHREPYLAVKIMNQRMLAKIDDAVLEGVPYSNAGGAVGTIGVIPEVEARGSETSYIQYNFTVTDFQNMTKTIDWNGGPAEYHGLQDLNQRQDINNKLFGLYPNGMLTYGSVGSSEEAAVSYGFKSFTTDTYTFHFHRWKGFSPEATFGYVPTQGNYRAFFGLFVPQGEVKDAKFDVSRPRLQYVYQKNPETNGAKIYSWDLGYTKQTKTVEASNSYHQIAYVGSRVMAAEQFLILRGLSLS
jgi:hypothetical protein